MQTLASLLEIALVQCTLEWENPEANFSHIETLIENAQLGAIDVYVLPEMFSTGFSMNTQELAENAFQGAAQLWLKKMAVKYNSAFCGSAMVRENDKFYNRFYWASPNGDLFNVDKRHLFRMAGENATYAAGNQRLIIKYKGWRIMPLVCYDLRFPIWSRNKEDYDMILYVANWPAARSVAWRTLLKARAIENLAISVGVNRVGADGKGIAYDGFSGVHAPWGDTITELGNKETVIKVSLSLEELEKFREKFPAHLDADEFEVK